MANKPDRVLLPTDVAPKNYYIHLTPDLKGFTFKGHEVVSVEVKNPTKNVTIHALDVTVDNVTFEKDGKQIQAKNITYEKTEETVTFEFDSELPVGSASLDINFTGNLNDQMMGFYRAKYFVNNETRYIATTQFEPTAARRAFPCWDEPAIKSTFEIELTFPENLIALSNMDPVSEKVSGGLKSTRFAPSPIMSTYLVAFIVGEFDMVEDKTKEGVRVRVYTPLGKKETGTFSLAVATKTLSYFTEYFSIPYPLPKLDMVAIADFAAGAMENWGLVTYRETALLIDEKVSGVRTKSRVAYVVAHELAHQWFGNLVTMEWWKELWLNEGFATFVGNQAIDYLFPEWDVWTQFVSDYFNSAQKLDGLVNSHPIEVEVRSSAQIEEIFDAISYHKGASVIRMISNQIGEENFRKGLTIYLNRHKYKNAVTEDLWAALSESSGFDVKSFMDGYTKVTGYPLVTIHSTDKPGQYDVSQTRFYSNGQVDSESALWWVSIPIATSADPKKVVKHDLKTRHGHITVDPAAQWFKANAGQTHFFRVQYSQDISAKLQEPLEKLQLSTVDRIGLQSDVFALAVAGLVPTTQALQLAKSYVNEVDYTVWADLSVNLGHFANVWSNEPNADQVKTFQRKLFSEIFNKLGWEPKPNEGDLMTLLRPIVINKLGLNGHDGVVAEARKRFVDHQSGAKTIPADIREIVYRLVVAFGTEEDYNKVLDIYRTADMQEEKLRALRALGYTKNPDLINKLLNFSLTEEVRAQDLYMPFFCVQSSGVGRELAWKFMQDRFSDIHARIGNSGMLIDRTIGFATGSFADEEKATEIQSFFEKHPVPHAERTIKQSIEAIKANAKWLKANREAVAQWLATQ